MPDTAQITNPHEPAGDHARLFGCLVAAINHVGVPHGVLLDVLHGLYRQVALQYPCCWGAAEFACANTVQAIRDARTQAAPADAQASSEAAALIARAARSAGGSQTH